MGSGPARQTTGSNQNMDVAAVVGRDQELDEHPHHAAARVLARDVLAHCAELGVDSRSDAGPTRPTRSRSALVVWTTNTSPHSHVSSRGWM